MYSLVPRILICSKQKRKGESLGTGLVVLVYLVPLFYLPSSPLLHQLPFSLLPLLHATSSEKIMGQFKNSMYVHHQYTFYVGIVNTYCSLNTQCSLNT